MGTSMHFQRSRGEALAAWNYFSCCLSRTIEEVTVCFMSVMRFSQCRHSSLALLRHWAEILGFSMSQMVKNPPEVQQTQVWSLGWEGPLEKKMATHSSILAWKIPWREEPGGLESMGSKRIRHNRAANTSSFLG